MVDLTDPFEADPTNRDGIASEWTAALGDPRVKGALLQFGLQLMQPMPFGQSPMGHLATGIGAAGENLSRQTASDLAEREEARKETDTESKGLLNEARAGAATARAETATVRSAAEANRAEIAREKLTLQRVREQNLRQSQIAGLYQKYLERFQKNSILNPNQGQPMSLPDFAKSNMLGHMLVEQEGGGQTPLPSPQVTPLAPSVDPLEGRTATGPDGSRIIRRNGRWEPINP